MNNKVLQGVGSVLEPQASVQLVFPTQSAVNLAEISMPVPARSQPQAAAQLQESGSSAHQTPVRREPGEASARSERPTFAQRVIVLKELALPLPKSAPPHFPLG